MIKLVGGPIKAKGRSLTDFPNASVSYDFRLKHLSGGTSSTVVDRDATLDVYTGAIYYKEGVIVVNGLRNVEFENLDPTIGSVGNDGSVTRLASGVMRVIVKSDSGIALLIEIDLVDKNVGAESSYEHVAVVEGSLASHCINQIDSRINSSMSMEVNGKVFTTQNHAAKTYVRNPNLWCADIDLTCVSPWNSNGGVRRAGTLVTPRHFLNSAHYELNVGDTVRFVAADGTVHDRTIIGKKRHPSYVKYSPDLTVYTLSSDLPSSISPCEVMPANWNNYLVRNYDNRPPALGLDQEEKALIIDFNGSGKYLIPEDSDRLIFHELKISGDSGNPAFLIKNGKLVFDTCWTIGGAGGGTSIAAHINTINNFMIPASDAQAGISTGYTVTEADFSSFTDFS